MIEADCSGNGAGSVLARSCPLARDDGTGTALHRSSTVFRLIPALALRQGPDSAHAASPCAQGPPPDIRAHQLSHPLWLLWLVSPLFSSIHPQDRPCARTRAWPDTGLAAKCGPRPPSRPLAGSGEQLRMRQCRIATNWIKSPLHQAGLPRAALRPQRDPGCKGNRIAAAPRAMGPGPLPVFTMPAHGCHSTAVFPCRPLSSTVKCGSKRRKTTVLRVSCDLQRANLALGPTQNFGETLP